MPRVPQKSSCMPQDPVCGGMHVLAKVLNTDGSHAAEVKQSLLPMLPQLLKITLGFFVTRVEVVEWPTVKLLCEKMEDVEALYRQKELVVVDIRVSLMGTRK